MLYKKYTMVLVMLMLAAVMATASACAASAGQTADNGLIFKPVSLSGTHSMGLISPMTVSGSIAQGQTNWYTKSIGTGCPGFYVDLNWGNPSNSLRLRIYAPDGKVYGPYYDSSDGRIDGRYYAWVTTSSGTVPAGTYYYEVYGDKVNGLQSYTI
jgi:hypothetical protein